MRYSLSSAGMYVCDMFGEGAAILQMYVSLPRKPYINPQNIQQSTCIFDKGGHN
ncbi:hypothetical protein Sjap_007030 [Stephania japonica]|uniref:Uncharacterized protein n=1 Tax=Stephania japonica TaxID=461633 RepID=A0AAP0PKB0_9MAGN